MEHARLVVLLVAVVALAQAQSGPPLLPPRQRVDANAALMPLYARKLPSDGERYTNPSPSMEPSMPPQQQRVDPSIAIIGNELLHRNFMDYPEDLQFVFPEIRFPGAGVVQEWNVYTGRNCKLQLQVFRPAPTPLALDENSFAVKSFALVGTNEFEAPALGEHRFQVPKDQQIETKNGDVIGFYSTDPGCISWSDGGTVALYRYGFPGHNELKAFSSVVFIGDGLVRTYSIYAKGIFNIDHPPLQARVSPTPTVSLSASKLPTASPSRTPTGSVSTSTIPSYTPSISPDISVSESESPSPSESATSSPSPSPDAPEGKCAGGVLFWCASKENMQLCNVTEEICSILQAALNPTFPSPDPSVSPVAPSAGAESPSETSSTSVSASPTLAISMPSITASPTPSTSYVVPPYVIDPAKEIEGAGLTPCHYCNGGTDWTGGICMTGKEQSPVSLKFGTMEVDEALNLYVATKYNISRAVLGWNDFAFTISSNNLGSINIDGKNYDAEMAMIRAPSEHKLENARTPMELQIFHRERGSNPPRIVAIAVLFEETAEEVPQLDWMFSISKTHEPQDIVVDLEEFLSDQAPLVFYNGSMTVPPCQEGILWGVTMGSKAKVSFAQMKALDSHLKLNRNFAGGRGNNRKLQELGNRKLVLRSNCGMSGAITCGRDAEAPRFDLHQHLAQVEKQADNDDMFGDSEVRLW